jgi:hypothetical protein
MLHRNIRKILSDNWTLEPDDKDMIVTINSDTVDGAKSKSILRWYAWEDQTYTAMAKTVGLPVAMATC